MILRSLPNESGKIFLTFDDGPDRHGTAAVLDVLARTKVPATFFLIADKIPEGRDLVERMQSEGHAVGNHSLDHRYRNFFRSRENLKLWLERGASELAKAGVQDSVGFRPPAGILTPRLKDVATELDLALILWNERFYDAVIPWTTKRALRSASRIQGGSIVLLHDRQRAVRVAEFCRVLEVYIEAIRARGFEFARLPSVVGDCR